MNRAAFGPRPGDVERLRPQGQLEKWFDEQLEPEKIDDSAVMKKVAQLPNLDAKIDGQSMTANFTKSYELGVKLIRENGVRKIVLAAESKRQLEQVMVDFWFNHFSVDTKIPRLLSSYERDVIHAHVFGKFGDMLKASAQHPMMLYYLDNWTSAKKGAVTSAEQKKIFERPNVPDGVNENYGREILELHTVGLEGGYTQKDVENTSLVFTGWTIANFMTDPHFTFVESWHDRSNVTILGKSFDGETGLEQGLNLLRFLSESPKTARFVSKKLCRHFVMDPEPKSCVERLSRVYLATGGDLKEIYRSLFTSPEFWDEKTRSNRTKKAFEFVASGLRSIDSDIRIEDKTSTHLYFLMNALGETLFACPNPNGYSDLESALRNPVTVLSRVTLAEDVVVLANSKLKTDRKHLALAIAAPEFQRR